jgi:hypothetical protein
MPWKETCIMDERVMFIAECLRGELPMTALCEGYGISRKTGYEWLGRYRSDPVGGFRPVAGAASSGAWLPDTMAEAIVGLRLRHPHWAEEVASEVAERAGRRRPGRRRARSAICPAARG